ncbi:MAG: HAMP domain-containing sensor histidine kinase [Acetivibrio sp.]
MDTKLKNITRKWYTKGIAYGILLACVMSVAVLYWSHADRIDLRTLNAENYLHSNLLYDKICKYTHAMHKIMDYESKEALGLQERNREIEEILKEPYRIWADSRGTEKANIIESYEHDVYFSYEKVWNVEEEPYVTSEDKDKTEEFTFAKFLKTFPELKEQVRKLYMEKEEKTYQDNVNYVKEQKDFVYESEDANLEQVKERYGKYPVHVTILKNGKVQSNLKGIENIDYPILDNEKGKNVYIGMPQSVYEAKEREWSSKKEITEKTIQLVIFLICLGFAAFCFLVLTTGRRPKEQEVHLYSWDRLWSEAEYGIGILAGMGFLMLSYSILEKEVKEEWIFKITLLGLAASGSVLLLCLLSQIRRVKAKKFWEGFISFRILKNIFKKCSISWKRGKLSKRALIAAVLLPVLCATWVGAPFVIALLIYLIYKYMGDFNEITEGTKKIKEGQLDYKIQLVNKEGILEELAENINTLSQGLDAAVSNELRSERLKSELISNVSHDLKTPLTSIVTYVDLLKKEKTENETVKGYIDIIDRKAQRLTVLTNDLFEAAKASSGDMPVNLEKIDFNAIVRQAMGEFDEKLKKAELEVRMKLPETEAYVKADGRLTWRVLDNLLSNVVKYAQSGSRVYMEVETKDGNVFFTMKNISAYELNIQAEELMERFKRGDESRNSEGSGLGLSIANSLIALQHGSFRMEIDGDLFKVILSLPAAME